MLVILRENIKNLGQTGDLVNVSNGYARNFLLPRSLVVFADKHNIAATQHHQRMLEKKRLTEKQNTTALAEKLKTLSCTLSRKVAEHDRLFGSVTTTDIKNALQEKEIFIEKQMILLPSPIKTLGQHIVNIKLDVDINVSIQILVTKEE